MFHSFLYVYQRVSHELPMNFPFLHHKSPVFHRSHKLPMNFPPLNPIKSPLNPIKSPLNHHKILWFIRQGPPFLHAIFVRWDVVWLHCASGSRQRRHSTRWQDRRTCTDHPEPLEDAPWVALGWWETREWLRNDVGGIDGYWYMFDTCYIYICVCVCLIYVDICWYMFDICLTIM